MRNGLAPESPLNQASIHFTQIPSYDEALLNEKTERNVKRMQQAIETGRLIRDTKKISMKYPLQAVTLVDADQEVLEGYRLCEKYIKEELNCLALDLQSDEDAYVVYKAVGENRAMGQAFGKKFDKKVKAAIEALSSDQIRAYLKTGAIEVAGLPVTAGMLKVSKDFNQEYLANERFACACSDEASVLLTVEQTEELRRMGLAREVVNRIQRLRKTSGISIDDQIEVYWRTESELMAAVLAQYTDKVVQTTRMPFLPHDGSSAAQVFIGETEFVDADNESNAVKIQIYLAGPKFVQEKLAADFAANGPSFVDSLKSVVI